VIEVEPYETARAEEWNRFVPDSKNGTFLFDRGYCEYHSDRFVDASLLLFDGTKLVGLLPATIAEADGHRIVTSHGGLTYGGVVCDHRMTTTRMLECFDAIIDHFRSIGVDGLVYRAIPHIYHSIPADEDLYALFRNGARLVRRDHSSALRPRDRSLTKGRRHAISRGRRAGLSIEEGGPFEPFMAIEEELLTTKHGVRPTHTAEEITELARRFPDNIRLIQTLRDGELLGGCVMFETPVVAHVQYIASTEAGREVGALDLLFDALLSDRYAATRWFDFGVSTTNDGRVLNKGLAANKESWGARTILYDTYEVDIG
jgi:hypothetical protein